VKSQPSIFNLSRYENLDPPPLPRITLPLETKIGPNPKQFFSKYEDRYLRMRLIGRHLSHQHLSRKVELHICDWR